MRSIRGVCVIHTHERCKAKPKTFIEHNCVFGVVVVSSQFIDIESGADLVEIGPRGPFMHSMACKHKNSNISIRSYL